MVSVVDRKRNIVPSVIFGLVLLGVSVVFCAFFSYFTTPLSNVANGFDAAFYRMVGQGMTKGYLPYRDFFDMKGLYFFFVQYLGQLISYGRIGIFILQCINFFLILYLITKIFGLFINERYKQLLLLIPVILVFSFTYNGGNLTEEFSFVPVFVCLYVVLLYFKKRDEQMKLWQKDIYVIAGLCFGISFGILSMIRITNAAFLCAMVLIIIVSLIVHHKYKELGICALSFLVGLALSLIPAVLFCLYNGTFKESIDAMFVLGFKYSGEKTWIEHITEIAHYQRRQILLLVLVPGVIPLVMRWRSWEERAIAFVGALCVFWAIASGNNYMHYYMLTIPLIPLCEIPIAEGLSKSTADKRAWVSLSLLVIMLVVQYPFIESSINSVYRYVILKDNDNTLEIIQDVSTRIPEDERDSVYIYNINPAWYTYADIFPCIKYCGWQEHYIELMPEIAVELEERFDENPPAWLVLKSDPGPMQPFLEEAVANDYELTYENGYYCLYHHIDE